MLTCKGKHSLIAFSLGPSLLTFLNNCRFERSGRGVATNWPYSTVANHWPGEWKAATLQPRSDVTVRFKPNILN